jgi:hypothetical protein
MKINHLDKKAFHYSKRSSRSFSEETDFFVEQIEGVESLPVTW